jgi:hypothetical protein
MQTRAPGEVAADARSGRRGAPLPVAAGVAALWAAVVGFAPVLAFALAGATGTGAGASATLRIAGGGWLLGHGVPVSTPTDRITLVPLAITAWVGWRLTRAGLHASRAAGAQRSPSPWPAVGAGLAVAVAYGILGAVTAVLAGTADVRVSPLRAAFMFGLLAAVTAVAGAVAHGRSGPRLLRRAPVWLVEAVRVAIAAVAFLVASGAAVAGFALARSGGDATQMLHAYGTGVAGQLGITALCLVFLPNLAIWGASYLVGPGFAVGTGTVVSPGDVLVGPLPALPVVPALPSGQLTGVATVLLGLPFAAGLVAGLLLGRSPAGAARLVGTAVLAGPIAGILVYILMLLSRGGLGSGRLAVLGPHGAGIPLVAAGVIGAGAVIGALSRRSLRRGVPGSS